jgi:hypothetical protein
MIRKRKLTVTYELPEELFNVLEAQAKGERRPMAEVVAEYQKESRVIRPLVSPEEEERLHQRLRSHFGSWHGGDPNGCDNEKIDGDSAREHGSGL